MDDLELYAAIWVDEHWKFYRLSDGAPSCGPKEDDYVIHLASGKLWVEHHEILKKLSAHLVAIPRSYLQKYRHIF